MAVVDGNVRVALHSPAALCEDIKPEYEPADVGRVPLFTAHMPTPCSVSLRLQEEETFGVTEKLFIRAINQTGPFFPILNESLGLIICTLKLLHPHLNPLRPLPPRLHVRLQPGEASDP